jgi:DNA-binding MarR family transcriptional regulator
MKATRASAAEGVIREINEGCLLMRTRLISRVMTAVYDEGLRPFGIGSPQFALLVIIGSMEPATRAEIGRHLHQDRSTLTRNLKLILTEGWAEEIQEETGGRARPLVLTKAGKDLVRSAAPVWRAAQSRAKAMLGKDDVFAVMDMANRIMKSESKA